MGAYSKDLRARVLTAVDRNERREEMASPFGVSLATIGRQVKRRRETGEVVGQALFGRIVIIGSAESRPTRPSCFRSAWA